MIYLFLLCKGEIPDVPGCSNVVHLVSHRSAYREKDIKNSEICMDRVPYFIWVRLGGKIDMNIHYNLLSTYQVI